MTKYVSKENLQEYTRKVKEYVKSQAPRVNAYDSIDYTDDYRFVVSYSQLDYDFAKNHFKSLEDGVIGSCSSFRQGDYYVRQYDWDYSNMVSFVTYTPHTKDHFMSVGTASGLKDLTLDFVSSQEYSELYKVVPFYLLDGINEYGVYCSMNVVHADKGVSEVIRPQGTIEDEVCLRMLPRYVLDHFKTADEAKDYIEQHLKMYLPQYLKNQEYELHFMLGDEDKTYALEIISNHAVFMEQDILTNFYISGVEFNEDGTVYTPADVPDGHMPSENGITDFGSGLERYNLIVKEKASVTSHETARVLANKLMYTRCYPSCILEGGAAFPTWYTEFVGTYYDVDYTVNDRPGKFNPVMDVVDEWYVNRSRTSTIQKTWQTVHSAIYNIKEGKLYLICQENLDHEMVFDLKHYYTAAEVDALIEANKPQGLTAAEIHAMWQED